MSGQYHCAVMFLLLQPESLKVLAEEVRATLTQYEDIDAGSIVALPFLNAVMNETLRMTVNVADVIPRESPGAMVDGNYISKGARTRYLASPQLLFPYSDLLIIIRFTSTLPTSLSRVVRATSTTVGHSGHNVGFPKIIDCTIRSLGTMQLRHSIHLDTVRDLCVSSSEISALD